MSIPTFLWHDYETFGRVPRRDRPAQFAAIRTDADLNEIGEPLMLYCQPANDFLPDPEACLLTGITPQHCVQNGIAEHAFADQIQKAFAAEGTIGVGYNSIRFDDEVTRFLFWRNLIDPYAREWQNNCGRWDLLDVVRLTYALRPDGIEWPLKPDGSPSFKLEALARANGLLHEAAHDALSDVRATIALARLIRDRQPKLFQFALGLHRKARVAEELGLPVATDAARPFLHVSGMFSPGSGCLAVMWPLGMHPTNRNELLAWDLAYDPSELIGLSADDARLRLFTRTADLPEGMQRLPLKSVHLNKSPMVVGNLRTLSSAMAQRWDIDMDLIDRHATAARLLPDLRHLWEALFRKPENQKNVAVDVDEDLYGGLLGDGDRRRLTDLRGLAPEALARDRTGFDDPRLEELVFRYRARNFPAMLSPEESERWETHRAARLFEGEGGGRSIDQFFTDIDTLGASAAERGDERAEGLLGELYDYAEAIAPESA